MSDICEEREPFVEAYDIAVLFDVLEHIPHTQPFLSSVIRHIKPNGCNSHIDARLFIAIC
jgi:2-polyprenyl-3-methyl-5-hydroxy-6-metoxy-1,4-benzoquinol methylase